MKLRVGQEIPLFRQIPDGDLTRVVKAILKDADGNALPESPVTLTHIGDGMHSDISVTMPATPRVFSQLQIFENDGTTPTSDEIVGGVFEREIVSALGKTIIGVIDKGLKSIDSPQFEITRGEDALIPIKFLIEELGDTYSLDDADLIQFQFDKSDGSTLSLTTESSLGAKEEIEITTIAAATLNQAYFTLYDENGSVVFWIDLDDSGSSAPAAAGLADRNVEITTILNADDADTVATKLGAAIDADSKFELVSVVSNLVTIRSADLVTLDDPDAGTSGFTFEVTTQGITPFDVTVEVDTERAGVANAILSQIDSNSLSLGHDRDIKAIIDKGTERTIVNLRNVLRVVD